MRTTKNGIGKAPGRGATMTHESRTKRLCSTGGVSSQPGVSKMRRPLSRRLVPQEFLLRDPFLTMAFAQLTYRKSWRDIEACLRSMHGKLYTTGFRCRPARSTLAAASESRDWRLHADFSPGSSASLRRC